MNEVNCKLVIEVKEYNGVKYNDYKLYIGNTWIKIKPNDSTSKEVLEEELKKLKESK